MSPYRPRYPPQIDQCASETPTPPLVQPLYVSYIAAGGRIPGFKTTTGIAVSMISLSSIEHAYVLNLTSPSTCAREACYKYTY